MNSLSLPALVALVLAATFLAPPLRAEDDTFQPIEAQMTNRAVVMKLTSGVRRVRLRVRTEEGAWKTVTIAHLEGSEGFLKLRLPDDVAEEDCEVSISRHDPFPYRVYQGATKFDPTDSDGNQAALAGGERFAAVDAASPEGEEVVEESDIWKWRDETLYFFNQYKGLQAIDVSDPAAPRRLATYPVDGYGEQMYIHPQANLVMLLNYDRNTGDGRVDLVAHVSPTELTLRDTFRVPGAILESRLIGNILYVISRDSWRVETTDQDGVVHVLNRSGLAITKIDLNDPENPIVDYPLSLGSELYSYWGAQVQATSEALLISTNAYDQVRGQSISTVHVVDISNPNQLPQVSHRFQVAGEVRNKFNMRLRDDVLTVVSQIWRNINGTRRISASVETFDLATGRRGGSLTFANNETITAARFSGDLLYVVTFLRIDPLFVIDLSRPLSPRMVSELEIPGFSTYLQPYGEDALLSIGVEDSKIAVSWFDVSDPSNTSLASRVYIGAEDGWAWTEANWDEKAFGYYPADDLLLVPYQGFDPEKGRQSGVQLVELGARELTKRGSFEHQFQARRAKVLDDAVVSISGRALRSLDISDRDNPKLLAELMLAWPVNSVSRKDDRLYQLERGDNSWQWWGSSADSSFLHLSPADDAEELITTLELPGGELSGSFLHDNCLFVAQTRSLIVEGEPTRVIFTTSVIDLGDPDRPIIVGSHDHTSEIEDQFGWGFRADYTGTLLPDGTLLWHPSELSSAWGFPLRDLDWGPGLWAPPTPGRAYSVDISDKTNPRILASVGLETGEETWSEGAVIVVGSTLYYGTQKSEPIAERDETSRWIARHWLGHVDFSDPAHPVEGDPAELPGTFEHGVLTPSGGHLLFSTHRESYRDQDDSWHQDLKIQTLAFDGVNAFLIAEVTAPDWAWGAKAFEGATMVLGDDSYADDLRTAQIDVYRWDFDGAFLDVQKWKFPDLRVYDLHIEDDLLIIAGGDLTFIDFADPSDPTPSFVTFRPRNYYWHRPGEIEIHERSFAYVPQNIYGVEVLDFGGAFDPNPDPGPQPSERPNDEWDKVPLEWLPLTYADNSLMLAALPPTANWSICIPGEGFCMSYEDWARQAFQLDEGDPIPDFSADDDRDGRDNGWEYFTGTDPQEARHYADFEIQLVTDRDGEQYLSGHVLVNPSAPVLSNMIPELSHDLIEWQSDTRLFEVAAHPFELRPGLGWRTASPVRDHKEAFLRVKVSPALPGN